MIPFVSSSRSLAKVYTGALHHHFGVMYATWLPSESVQLGDYGLLRNNIFTRVGNVAQLGIGFGVRRDTNRDNYEFATAESVNLRFSSRGSVEATGDVATRARLEIHFAKAKAFLFVAAQCSLHSVENQANLGMDLVDLARRKVWDVRHVVVTSLIESGATTIIGSLGADAMLAVEADSAALETINLADTQAGLRLTSASNVGIRIVARDGLTPLMRLSKVEPPRWLRKQYRFNPDRRRAYVGDAVRIIADDDVLPTVQHDYVFRKLP